MLVVVASRSPRRPPAWNVAWNPARPTLASCSTDKSVRLYSYAPASTPDTNSTDTAPSSYRFSLESTIPTSHARTVRALAFSPTGATLATASFDSTVGIWCQVSEAGLDDGDASAPAPAGEWEPVDPLEGHESECKSVAWSADGRLLASCSRDKSVWVWEGPPRLAPSFRRPGTTDDVRTPQRSVRQISSASRSSWSIRRT